MCCPHAATARKSHEPTTWTLTATFCRTSAVHGRLSLAAWGLECENKCDLVFCAAREKWNPFRRKPRVNLVHTGNKASCASCMWLSTTFYDTSDVFWWPPGLHNEHTNKHHSHTPALISASEACKTNGQRVRKATIRYSEPPRSLLAAWRPEQWRA